MPIVANVEENLLFARLVAGEITTNGEEPPSYQAVKSVGGRERRTSSGSAAASVMTARGRTSIRGGPGGSQNGSSPGSGSTSRGRSVSVDMR